VNTATQTPDAITAAHPPTNARLALDRDLVRWATEYAMHASPEQLDRQMRRAYGDHGPDSYKRSVEQRAAREQMQSRQASPTEVEAVNAEAVNAPSKTRRVRSRRRIRPLRGLVKATCANERCSKPFEYEWPVVNKRYCSERCRWRAAARRARLRPVDPSRVPTPEAAEQVRQECLAAYARLTALLAEEEVER